MVVLVKAIKAPRLRDDAMRLVLLNAMRKAGRFLVKTDFKKTTKTWKHQPKFETLISLKPPGPTILIGTDDQVWNWLNEGTRPHAIFAGIFTGKSNKKALAFPSRFKPKTRVKSLKSQAGSSGGPTVVVPFVQHPGTEAREWGQLIATKRQRWFQKQMERAMADAAHASGHGQRSP